MIGRLATGTNYPDIARQSLFMAAQRCQVAREVKVDVVFDVHPVGAVVHRLRRGEAAHLDGSEKGKSEVSDGESFSVSVARLISQ